MVSTDEATTNYADILRNFEVAHDFLKSEFGVTPKIGWQLDPFGHSAANALLFAQMGMEAIFFARVNEQVHEIRTQDRDMQFIWTPTFNSTFASDDIGVTGDPNNEIFAHLLLTHYTPIKADKDKWLDRDYYTWGN